MENSDTGWESVLRKKMFFWVTAGPDNGHGKRDSKAKGEKHLPSFLLSIPQKMREPTLKDVRAPSVDFAGTIFFGGTNQCHPKPHSIAPSSPFAHLIEIQSKENIWDNLFKDVSPIIKTYPKRKKFHLVREKFDFVDVWPHRAPGVRVAAGRRLRRFVPNLGTSKSKISGETIMEILDQIPVDSSTRLYEREFKRERKRFLLEKNRKFLSPEKRAAHFHFPKAFVNVTVVGPRIPASLTVAHLEVTKEGDEGKTAEVGETDEEHVEDTDLSTDMEESDEDTFEQFNNYRDDT